MVATKADIRLHEGQLAILASGARVTACTAGQGGGKTLGGYYWLLSNMQAFPGESHLVGFPDYGLLQRVIINQPDPERQTLVEFLRGMGEHPHLHIQERRIHCFPSETVVNAPDIEAAYRRWYEGPLVTIETARGHKLTGTPNHPILTEHGWVPLSLLVQGDNVISRSGGRYETTREPDEYGNPARIDKIFNAVSLCGRTIRYPVTHLDFHGEGEAGYVDCVASGKMLGDTFKAPDFKHPHEFDFMTPNTASADFGSRPTSNRIMEEVHAALPFFGGHKGVLQLHDLGMSAYCETVFRQYANDDRTVNAMLPSYIRITTTIPVSLHDGRNCIRGQLAFMGTERDIMPPESIPNRSTGALIQVSKGLDSCASQVTPDCIIGIRQTDFCGHIYNLQTESGYYLANNIIAHNCDSGQIFFASGEDLVGWEGAHVKTAWLDEFDLQPLEAYKRALERTRMRHGYVLLTGTPRLVKWVGKELAPLWERGDPFVTRVQFPSTMNPRYSEAAMEEARARLPAWEFKRLHLGELAAMEGGNVVRREWWQYWRELPLLRERIFTVDTAFKDKTSDDYSVFAHWGATSTGFYLLDLWRAKAEYPDLKRALGAFYTKHTPGRVLVEDAASGQSLIQDLRRNSRMPILPIKVDRDKYTRLSAVTGLIEAGRCYLPESALWLHDFVEEHAEFPNGTNDDQVDTTSMALAWLGRREGAAKSEIRQTVYAPRRRSDNPLGLDLDQEKYRDRDEQ